MGIYVITSSAFTWDFAERHKIGGRAMNLLLRYLVENGVFPSEAVVDSVLLQILSMPHMPGSNAYAMSKLTQLPNIVTYDAPCGSADGHAEDPMFLEAGLQTHLSKTNRTLVLETQAINKFLIGANGKGLLDTNLAHGILVIKDLSHFYAYGKGLNGHLKIADPELIRRPQRPSEVNKVFNRLNQLLSMSKYSCIHILAIYLA